MTDGLPIIDNGYVMIGRWARDRSIGSYIGWALVAAVVLFIMAGLITHGIHIGVAETTEVAEAASHHAQEGDSALVHTFKAICPFH